MYSINLNTNQKNQINNLYKNLNEKKLQSLLIQNIGEHSSSSIKTEEEKNNFFIIINNFQAKQKIKILLADTCIFTNELTIHLTMKELLKEMDNHLNKIDMILDKKVFGYKG